MSLLFAHPVHVLAADSAPRQENINLNAGESQVIENLSPDSKPAIRVIQNGHALVVHNEDPSKLVLLGAEKGKWTVSVKLKDGEDVTYNINVNSIKNAGAPLAPGAAPAPMGDESSAIKADATTVAISSPATVSTLDSGTGPVTRVSEPGNFGDVPNAPSSDTVASESAKMGEPTGIPAVVPGSKVMPTQNLAEPIERAGKFTNDPGIAASGESYSTEGVSSSGGSHFLPADGISMMNGTSQVIDFQQRMRRVSIADTGVADVQVINPFELNLIGHKPGFTTLTVWTGQNHYEERQIRVSPNGKQQIMLNCIVAELDRGQVENQGINLSGALTKYGISGFGLPGNVANPYSATASLIPTTTNSVGQTINSPGELPTAGSIIPLLLSQGVTYGLNTQNSNFSTQSFFQFLENHNLAKILAEPRLLANSGEKAKFLSGGEIPIVVSQALNTSIVFKEFGTKVTFLPTVVGVNEMELLVQPEVSEPDYANGVSLFGFQVPAFVTRRAETEVRMRDNQTLIVAGLILHEKKQTVQKVPYLGDIPYVSGLFKNTAWTDTETDLVMSVTPQIVRPLPSDGQVYLPTARPPLNSEEIKTERLSTPDAARPRF